MIPVQSAVPTHQVPIVTYTLIGTNIALFAYETTLGARLEPFVLTYGWVPASFFQNLALGQVSGLTPLLVSMFLHGSWLHLLGNLLYLHIFGANVEDRLGAVRYLGFYCLGGVVAVLVQTSIAPSARTPMIGSSGAIAAVAGAYCAFYPNGRVLTVIPLIFWFRVVQVPAVCLLLLWLSAYVFIGIWPFSFAEHRISGEAWGAHVGGFVAGLILGPLFLLKKRRPYRIRMRSPSPLSWSS